MPLFSVSLSFIFSCKKTAGLVTKPGGVRLDELLFVAWMAIFYVAMQDVGLLQLLYPVLPPIARACTV